MDRFSSLPDEIICHIVSFVSAKEAAFASVLSKRWKGLYTIIPDLEFMLTDKNQGSFTEFLDGLLALPASSRIRNFSLKVYAAVEPADYIHVNRCLSDVFERGLMDLDFSLYVGAVYSLPIEFFTCNTIVKLELGRRLVIGFVPENAFLPALKTVFLCSVQFFDIRGCSFHKLLSACPVLEELDIHDVNWEQWKWSHTVSSPSLQRLTIKRGDLENFDGSDFGNITFDTPNLTYLHYHDFVPWEHPSVNFSSLVEANLEVLLTVDNVWQEGHVEEDDTITSDPTNLLKGLRNVQILKLLSTETMEMLHLFHEAVPVFESLHHLTLKTEDDEECWSFFPFLLKKTPNLKTLVIHGPMHCNRSEEPGNVCKCLSGYSCLCSVPIEVLEITYWGETDELEQLKHFLGKLSYLKCVKVRVVAYTDKAKLRMTTDLLMIPRASVNCKIQVFE